MAGGRPGRAGPGGRPRRHGDGARLRPAGHERGQRPGRWRHPGAGRAVRGWTATLNGRALRPITTPVDGWAQGFALPPGGGQLSISRNNLARAASLLAELVVLLAVCVLALPGKRAEPAEAADALAALREARDAKRGARGQPRSGRAATEVAAADGADTAVPAAGTSGRRGRTRRPGVAVAGLGGATRLAMARRRGRGQEADD